MLDIAIKTKLGDFPLSVVFQAPKGLTAVFGRSGVGKTSLINAVAGLVTPDEGRIAVDDRVLFDSATKTNTPTQKRRAGYVFQDARLFPHMTVIQNLRYGGTHDETRVIDMLGLDALLDRRPATLSGGERQRTALARALMSDPQILLMDEPLAALDAPRKAEIMPYIERLRDEVKIPIIYVTHDVSEVARLATTLVVLDAGKVVLNGPVEQVLSDPAAVPLVGVRDAGAVIMTKVAGRMLDDNLTELAFSGGRLVLPGQFGALGQRVRVRIPAQDVIISREKPEGLSALNILRVTVSGIEQGQGPGVAVGLTAGNERILARITRRSARLLGLEVGQEVYAILKATAVGPQDVGG